MSFRVYSVFGGGGSHSRCFGNRWELTIFRQSERYRIKVVYQARPAIALSDSVEGTGVPRSPPYLSMLDE